MQLLICSPKPASESAQFLEQALKREGHSTIWADQAESETAGADAAYYRGRFDSQGNTEAMMAFSEIDAADLSKSGPSDDFRMSESEASLGGFKPAQVMFHALLFNINSHLTNYFCSEIYFNGKIANWV